MYSRHLAWLNATPEKAEKPRRELYTEGSPYLNLPPLSEYEQSLIGHWMQAGTVEQTANGLIALSWQEVNSWANRFHKDSFIELIEHPRQSARHKKTYSAVVVERCSLVDWELDQIKKLSQEYASEYSQASKPDRACPTTIFIDDVSEDDAIANAKKIREAFKMMFGKQDEVIEIRNE